MTKILYKLAKSLIFSIFILVGITYLLFFIGVKASSISIDTDIHYDVLQIWIPGSEKRKIRKRIQELKKHVMSEAEGTVSTRELLTQEILQSVQDDIVRLVIAHTRLKQGAEAIAVWETNKPYLINSESDPSASLRVALLQYALACAYFYKGDMKKSLEFFDAYLDKYPDDLSANLNYASILISTKRELDDAFKRTKRMIKLYPDCPASYFRIGQALVAKKKYPEAISYLNHVDNSDKTVLHKARALIDQIRNNGLDQTYWNWFSKTIRLDLGYSPTAHLAIRDELFNRLKRTLLLTGSAIVISIVLAFPIGLLSAYRPYSVGSSITIWSIYIFSGIPVFLLGYLAYQLFSPRPGTSAYFLFMAVCLAFGNGLFSQISKSTNQEVKEILSKNFIIAVRARHANEFVHLIKNLAMPLLTIIAARLPLMLSGTIIVEYIFNYRGVGSWILDAAQKQDFPVLLTTTATLAGIVLVVNLLKDFCHALIDTRLAND